MVSFKRLASIAAVAFTLIPEATVAHPGMPHQERSLAEISASQLFRANARRSLAACANSKYVRELKERATARRLAQVTALREERRRLTAAEVLAKDHKSNLTDITPSVDPATLFGSSPKCILEPETTQGPYYVKGELIRNDIRETQAGVDLYAELQFIDVNTCTPVADYYVDFWHCNSTGVYSGIVASTNGNKNDKTNINATFERGLAPTDQDGVVQFITKFPGHYTSRANHIHVLGSHGGSVLANNTYASVGASSVGQLFFDQSLITEVEKTAPYSANKQQLTLNSADSIFAGEAKSGFDPVFEYVYLGESVTDGLFGWISIGIDATVSKTVKAAATWTADGGVAN